MMAGHMACYIEPLRIRKWRRIVGSFARGIPGSKLLTSTFDDDASCNVVYGQIWSALHLIPDAIRSGKPYFHLDNGWVRPGKGERDGYYRVTRNGCTPIFLPGADPSRAAALNTTLRPWRPDGGHILICMPGPNFGRAWGLDMNPWIASIEDRVRSLTNRRVVVRPKLAENSLARDLAGAWCVVTHSSNVSVEAVIAGIPAIVEETSPTAPLGNVGLGWMRDPYLSPLRGEWLSSLAWQQFTTSQMESGEAWDCLNQVGLGESDSAACGPVGRDGWR